MSHSAGKAIAETPDLEAIGHRLIKRRSCHLPGDRHHSENRTDATEHKRDDASGLEPCRQRGWAFVLPLEVEDVCCVSCGVSGIWRLARTTDLEMVLWHTESLLELEWGFDHGCDKTRVLVPALVQMSEHISKL